jgi:glycolate oxidase iron-sulfur subunit
VALAERTEFAALQPLERLMDACVHCGFCLATCPSYQILGTEGDSPRGRIHLMRAGAESRLAMSAAVVERFDTCLGCMACETACPSGVHYAPLIEEMRGAIESGYRRPLGERIFRQVLFLLLPFPRRLRTLARFSGLLRRIERWPRLMALMPVQVRSAIALSSSLPAIAGRESIPVRTPAIGASRLRAGLVTGCVQSAYFHGVNEASVRVLAAEGCDVITPPNQGCCGALAFHAGLTSDARQFARRLIAAFEDTGVDRIVVNAAGCGSTLKSYGKLLKDDPEWHERAGLFASRVQDISETLADLTPPRAIRHPVAARVAYHDACHLAHAQGIRQPPRTVLASIPGVTVVPVADGEICCGSAGIFNLVQPALAEELGRRKVQRLAEASPTLVVTSNPGCIVQITSSAKASGANLRVVHLAELLDESLHAGAREGFDA